MPYSLSAIDLVLVALSVLISALCSGLEIAYVTSNKLYFELQRKEGTIGGRLLADLLQRPSRVLGALLVGNNIAMVVYGIVMARMMEPWLRDLWPHEVFVLVAQTTLSTMIILVFAEFLPKTLFRLDPNGTLSFFAIPLRLLYVVLWVPMMLMTGISEVILKLFGIRTKPGQMAFGRIDLNEFLKEVSDNSPQESDMDAEVEYFRNTLELSSTKVRDLMTPRAEIEAIDVDEPVAELLRQFTETGMSKLLIYKDNVDNVIGYVHSNEMFKRPRSIRAVMRTVSFIPGTMPADQVLQMFIKQRSHVAVVVDEFGGTAGILTIEDVVEVIVGDIEDEHDLGDLVEQKLDEHEFLFSARVEVERLVDEYRLALPVSDEYETLAGYILHNTEELPQQEEVLEIGPFRFVVAQVSHGRIDLVRLLVVDTEKGYVA